MSLPEATKTTPDVEPSLQRALDIELLIDPKHTLPDVSVIPDPEARIPSGGLIFTKSLIVHDGEIVGTCTLFSNRDTRERWFHGVQVDQRGAGFGMAAYKEVIEAAVVDGYDFRTEDLTQTAEAAKVWERLAECGAAEVIEGFTPTGQTTKQGSPTFTGHYVVRAN